MKRAVVAIVGKPNVGKSSLFNRIVGERKSIVYDEPGVTRDRIYAKANWLTREFNIIDTGGIEIENRPFQESIRAQAEIAIDEADVIVMLCDGRTEVSDDDYLIAKMLKKSGKPVILAVNKIDDISLVANAYDYYKLGLDSDIIVVSETRMMSAASLSLFSFAQAASDGLPISSSPSRINLILCFRPPSRTRNSNALMCMKSCPLSSFAPRAYIAPSRISGSNGSECQSSIGSIGWTS